MTSSGLTGDIARAHPGCPRHQARCSPCWTYPREFDIKGSLETLQPATSRSGSQCCYTNGLEKDSGFSRDQDAVAPTPR
eukprot:9439765-Alexandrium_andersonii.AAC.1